MNDLTQAQKNKLLAAAEIVEDGDMAVLKKILEFQDYIEEWKEEIEELKMEVGEKLPQSLQIKIDDMLRNCDEKLAECDDMCSKMEEMMNSSKYKDEMQSMITEYSKKVSAEMSNLNKVIIGRMEEIRMMIPETPKEFDPSDILNRIKEIETKIPKIPDELTPYQIINKLESIDNESEKLKIEAIQDLRKELDDLKKKWASRPIFGGGGFNVGALNFHLVDDETPSGTVNGVNTDFTITHAPSPVSSLKVYLNGQRMRITEDYTFSGTTITFLTAPLTGSVLLVDYRT